MLKKWWRRRQEERALQEQRHAEAIVDAHRELEQWRHDSDRSDADRLPPVYPNTDWTGGGPL
jgi:hypothetical protein